MICVNNILLLYLQFVLTTVLVVMMETTNPATRVMDMFHASMTSYTKRLVQNFLKTNLSCGTTLNVDARYVPLPVTQTIYQNLTEELLQKIFFSQKLYMYLFIVFL